MPRLRLALAFLMACAMASCMPTPRPGLGDAISALGTIQDPRITEASGLTRSVRNPDCFYVHNDSGDQPRVFLIDRDGQTRLTIRLTGAMAVDYEDIALAPGATVGTFDVCVADIGDNNAQRRFVVVYRFPEVTCNGVAAGATIDVEPTSYRLRYADGPTNAEAFCVHPRTGQGYILTKRNDGQSAVYALPAPWDATAETTLSRVATLELPPANRLAQIITAADIAPDGTHLAARACLDGWEWTLPPNAADADFANIFTTLPRKLFLPYEVQGEALAYASDGATLLTVSEGVAPILFEFALPRR